MATRNAQGTQSRMSATAWPGVFVVIAVSSFGAGTAAPSLGEERAADVSVETIAGAWRSRTRRVQTLTFKWDDRYTVAAGAYAKPDGGPGDRKNPKRLVVPAETTVFDTVFAVTMDGDDIRHEGRHIWTSPDWQLVPQDYVWVHSNGGFRRFTPAGAVPNPKGYIYDTARDKPDDLGDPNILPLAIVYRPFSALLQSFTNFEARFRIVEGRHVIGDVPCVLLMDDPTAGQTTSLWVDPERDFIPMRLSRARRRKRTYDLTFAGYEQEAAAWVPAGWKSTFFGADENVQTTNDSTVRDHSLNAEITPDRFQLDFPVNTWVSDLRTQKDYIYKGGGKERKITRDELTSGAKYADFVRTEAGATRPARANWMRWLLIANASVVALFALVFLVRGRRHRGKSAAELP